MANKFVRVKDDETGHEYTVAERAVRPGLTVIDKPAVDKNNRPLPAKPNVKLPSGNGESTTTQTQEAKPSTTAASDKPKEATK